MEKEKVGSDAVESQSESSVPAEKKQLARQKKKKAGSKKKKSDLPGGLDGDAVGGVTGALSSVASNTVDSAQGGQKEGGGGGGSKSDTLRLRLDLNLEIEIQLKARIHGDLELALL